MESTTASNKAEHLCVLVHGLWGNPNHLATMAKFLREKHPEETLHILVATRNSGSFTYDGIEVGGERVCHEIEEEVEKLAKQGVVIKRFSLVGYSLGGLVARYAVGLLDNKKFFDRIKPVNFTSFASPHLGVRTPRRGWHNHIWNVLGARTLSASGRQLFTIDRFRETGRPLLEILADPESIFIKGLAKFERRTLYANIINDRSAVYYTTSISKVDPYCDIDKIKVNYLSGYEPVILNPQDPVAPLEPLENDETFIRRYIRKAQATVGQLPVFLAMIVFIPFGIVAFLLNSAVQSLRSSHRIKLYEKGLAGIQPGTYRVPLLITEMREAVEDVYENLNSAQSNEYLGAESESEVDSDLAGPSSPPTAQLQSTQHQRKQSSLSNPRDDVEKLEVKDLPMLALAPCQFKMIQALDNVGWRKFPVHIHKVRHSHAAIIVRMQRKSFDEGKLVLRHWLDEEFLI